MRNDASEGLLDCESVHADNIVGSGDEKPISIAMPDKGGRVKIIAPNNATVAYIKEYLKGRDLGESDKKFKERMAVFERNENVPSTKTVSTNYGTYKVEPLGYSIFRAGEEDSFRDEDNLPAGEYFAILNAGSKITMHVRKVTAVPEQSSRLYELLTETSLYSNLLERTELIIHIYSSYDSALEQLIDIANDNDVVEGRPALNLVSSVRKVELIFHPMEIDINESVFEKLKFLYSVFNTSDPSIELTVKIKIDKHNIGMALIEAYGYCLKYTKPSMHVEIDDNTRLFLTTTDQEFIQLGAIDLFEGYVDYFVEHDPGWRNTFLYILEKINNGELCLINYHLMVHALRDDLSKRLGSQALSAVLADGLLPSVKDRDVCYYRPASGTGVSGPDQMKFIISEYALRVANGDVNNPAHLSKYALYWARLLLLVASVSTGVGFKYMLKNFKNGNANRDAEFYLTFCMVTILIWFCVIYFRKQAMKYYKVNNGCQGKETNIKEVIKCLLDNKSLFTTGCVEGSTNASNFVGTVVQDVGQVTPLSGHALHN